MTNQTDKSITPRDKEATRKRLVQAVGAILARDGFPALGVNAIAREAGVDKVLIYRYFGGLAGLMAAFGREGDFWPTVGELVDYNPQAMLRLAAAERAAAILVRFVRAVRRRPLTQEVMAWEMVQRNELTLALEEIREKTSQELMERFGVSEPRSASPDLAPIIALLAAGACYLSVRAARGTEVFNSVDLQTQDGWQRLEEAIKTVFRGLAALENAPEAGTSAASSANEKMDKEKENDVE